MFTYVNFAPKSVVTVVPFEPLDFTTGIEDGFVVFPVVAEVDPPEVEDEDDGFLETATATPTAIAAIITIPAGSPKNSHRLLVGFVGMQVRVGLVYPPLYPPLLLLLIALRFDLAPSPPRRAPFPPTPVAGEATPLSGISESTLRYWLEGNWFWPNDESFSGKPGESRGGIGV